ncbi:hypothetical protein FB451DRAFT_1370361 [Mycena latifolia]|nr:hypothetical protein FB451DRAFT_1370361 [Mycena latifolia]
MSTYCVLLDMDELLLKWESLGDKKLIRSAITKTSKTSGPKKKLTVNEEILRAERAIKNQEIDDDDKRVLAPVETKFDDGPPGATWYNTVISASKQHNFMSFLTETIIDPDTLCPYWINRFLNHPERIPGFTPPKKQEFKFDIFCSDFVSHTSPHAAIYGIPGIPMSEKSKSALIGIEGVASHCMVTWFKLASNAQLGILQPLPSQPRTFQGLPGHSDVSSSSTVRHA